MTEGRVQKLFLMAVLTTGALLVAFAAPAAAAPPANDDFGQAQAIGPGPLPLAVAGTNVDATIEPGEPSHLGINANVSTVWYSWMPTAAEAGDVVVDVCDVSGGLDGPTALRAVAVYTGATLATLVNPPDLDTGAEAENGFSSCLVRFNAIASTPYSIAVDFDKTVGTGTFTLRIRDFAPPANDLYANAQVVGPALPISVPASTIDADWEANEPAGLSSADGSTRSIWFQWTASTDDVVRVDGCDSDKRTGSGNHSVGVFTDGNNTLPVTGTVATEDNGCQLEFDPVMGTVYKIYFAGWSRTEDDLTFEIRETTPPSNNLFANRVTVGPGLPVAEAGSNFFATGPEGGEPDHGGFGAAQRSVWYQWTPTVNTSVAINACDADFNSKLGVYVDGPMGGVGVNDLVPVGSAAGGITPYCYKRLTATAGTAYFIAVSSTNEIGNEGDFVLDIHVPAPPANDDFEAAQAIGPDLPLAIPGTVEDATAQGGEPLHNGFAAQTVWYSWTPAVSGIATIDTCDAGFDTRLAVYTGSVLNSLSQLSQSEDDCDGGADDGSLVEIPASAGTTYRIAVDTNEPGGPSGFTLAIAGPLTPRPPLPIVNSTTPTAPFDLKAAIKKCRKRFKGNRKKARKRKTCIKNAKKKAAAQ